MISRDGYNTSLWQQDVPPYVSAGKPSQEETYDIVIAGGGITGVSTALQLQQSGKKCLLIEAENLGFGTTGGTTAHINTLLDTPYTTIIKNFNKETAQQVAALAKQAIALIKSNIEQYQIECGFEETTACLFAQDKKEQDELDEITDNSRSVGLDIAFTSDIPVPVPFTKAIRVSGQAKFNPLLYVYGIAAAFEEKGGVILQHCRLTEIQEGESVQVITTLGTFTAKDLVFATHIPPGVNLLHLRCVPWRSYAMAVRLHDNRYPEALSYDMKDPYHYYRTQEVNGKNYLIAGGEDHQTGHHQNTEQCFLKLESHIRKYFDVEEISYKWSSQYFEPADGLPYIGPLPGHSANIYVATGFGGNGITYGTVSAILLNSMLQKGASAFNSIFDPNRIKPIAGFKSFIGHNAKVVKQFVEKFFSGEELQEMADMAPGEGRVVEYEGHKLALYKNEEGALHAVNPACTHLKCEVKWNSTERTWDCPCHGARYSYDGKVLTGPASADLKVIQIGEPARQH